MSSAFDFLLQDVPSTNFLGAAQQQYSGSDTASQQSQQPQSQQNHNQALSLGAVKQENGGLDWLLGDSSDVLAPHPDAFELELESIAALGALEGNDFASTLPAFNTQDTFNTGNINLYTQYRGNAPTALSAYSGYTGYGGTGAPSVITVSSESLSTYGSAYEPSFVEKHHHLPLAAVSSGAQQQVQSQSAYSHSQHPASLASLFPDLDLHLSAFNLSGVTTTDPSQLHQQQPLPPHRTMLPSRSSPPDENGDARSRGSSSAAYDSASPSYDPSTDFGSYVVQAGALAANTPYSGGKQVGPSASIVSPTSATMPRDDTSEHDPRKKYQCPSCPRAFARAFNLKTHMATHDPHRVKSFVCRHSGCGRSFSRKHDLGRHLVSIHQDSNPPTNSDAMGAPAPSSSSQAQPSSSSTAASSSIKAKTSSSSIGVGSTERIWCDTCGRGWLAGSKDMCSCKGKERVL